VFPLRGKVCGKLKFEEILGKLSLDVEALTKQNGVRLLRKLKKKLKRKVKTDLPYLSFYKKKPESHIFFFGLTRKISLISAHSGGVINREFIVRNRKI
jgi:hypothetical protein